MYDPEFTQLCIKTLNSYYSCNCVVLLGSLPNTPMTDYYQILFVEPPHENNWRYYHFKRVLDDNDIPYDEPCNVKPIKSKNYKTEGIMLNIQHLTKTYGEKKAVDDLSLHIKPGEMYAFIGHNGAGKTTTIKSCCGLLDFDNGDIYVDGISCL